ncbi:GntR family transcriptional regulator [Arthrobacter castelli]|uniref:GntR family transcriptional regulator n=1 Tax=Arthrobacter castelli TaxID=271431 RepID=UPI000400751C|nr:GntR family transcriptional regulator [Arthrobacter castelli]
MSPANAASGSAKLKRQVLRDDVCEALLDMILEEELKPGATISIDGLAKELGISPTPMREALAYLEHTGLVARAALKGYTVAPRLSPEQMADLIDARAIIELAAVSQAAQHPSALLERLRAAHRNHREAAAEVTAGDSAVPSARAMREYFNADWAFHLVLVEASGNQFLHGMLEGLGAHLHRMVQSAGRGVFDADIALTEHGQVLAAIEAGDRDRAVGAMRTHLANTQTRALADAAAGRDDI